jgi:hypothetical protein
MVLFWDESPCAVNYLTPCGGRGQAYTPMPQIFVETKQLYERSPALVLFLLYEGNLERIVTSFDVFIRARDLPFGRVVLF